MPKLDWMRVWESPDADRDDEIHFAGTAYLQTDDDTRTIKIPTHVYHRSPLPSSLVDYCIVYAADDTVYPTHVDVVSITDQDRKRGKVRLTVPKTGAVMFP